MKTNFPVIQDIKEGLIIAVLFCGVNASNAQMIVYDNTPADSFTSLVDNDFTFGDEVTLAGTDRTIKDFTIALQGGPSAIIVDLSLYFYNIGANDTVGTQIGSTITHFDVAFGSFENSEHVFSDIILPVPDSFIWAVSYDGGSSLGYGQKSTPFVGSSADGFYSNNGLGLDLGDSLDGNTSLSVEMTAVPEPGEYALALSTLLVCFALWRKVRLAGPGLE